jgi:hypothetical protein
VATFELGIFEIFRKIDLGETFGIHSNNLDHKGLIVCKYNTITSPERLYNDEMFESNSNL